MLKDNFHKNTDHDMTREEKDEQVELRKWKNDLINREIHVEVGIVPIKYKEKEFRNSINRHIYLGVSLKPTAEYSKF